MGVPQGGVLFPKLFNLYMSKLPEPIDNNVHLLSYAADTNIFHTDTNIDEAITNINK